MPGETSRLIFSLSSFIFHQPMSKRDHLTDFNLKIEQLRFETSQEVYLPNMYFEPIGK